MESLLESLNVEPKVILAQLIAFAVLLALLTKFLYRPLAEIMRQRQEQIANSISAAEAQNLKAESLRQEYEANLAGIADEARARLDQALKDAEAARQRMLDSTKTEIQELHKRSEAQLAREREQLRRELRGEIADIAVMAASKALRNQLDPSTQAAVIDQAIKDLDSLPMQ